MAPSPCALWRCVFHALATLYYLQFADAGERPHIPKIWVVRGPVRDGNLTVTGDEIQQGHCDRHDCSHDCPEQDSTAAQHRSR